MPSRRDQVRKSDSRKSGKSEQDQQDQEEQPQKSQKGKQKHQQQQQGNDRERADDQEDDPCGRRANSQEQRQQQQQQGGGQQQQCQGQQCARKSCQQQQVPNELNDCVKCGQETTEGQVINFNGRKWHPECFTCNGCCMVLSKVSFFLDGERIFCSSCWARNVKSNCSRCDGEITGDAPVVNFGIRRFHKSCFICSRCRCDLAGLQFCIKGNEFTCQQCM
ncbi:four and a half lim domains protein [Echinococcus multilocularis]|uniref:Four and a half lim domains protein n=1 Tax=Echinococcus multilocularis TaxID=6211 RepID=A0A087VZ44_ECHMU|nr:four and a half lim domains protein [Echinococcus multilocularis]